MTENEDIAADLDTLLPLHLTALCRAPARSSRAVLPLTRLLQVSGKASGRAGFAAPIT